MVNAFRGTQEKTAYCLGFTPLVYNSALSAAARRKIGKAQKLRRARLKRQAGKKKILSMITSISEYPYVD
jgi:hypothetical protein